MYWCMVVLMAVAGCLAAPQEPASPAAAEVRDRENRGYYEDDEDDFEDIFEEDGIFGEDEGIEEIFEELDGGDDDIEDILEEVEEEELLEEIFDGEDEEDFDIL